MLLILGIITVLLLSYWNGANDVSKTIATIVGSRIGNYRRAVILGATFNAIGTFLALFFAQALFKVFTQGLLKESQISEIFAISVIFGVIAWLVIATKIGMPVSTTHSMIGAIIFLGLFVFSFAGILWNSVLLKIVLPLLLSPIVAYLLAFSIFWLYSKNVLRLKNFKIIRSKALSKVINVDNAHWISCAASSFARGMNDGPKFVALAATFLISTGISQNNIGLNMLIFALVALAMGLGGIIHGFKVTNTLSTKITKINHTDGFIANLITSVLVSGGASLGVPMSTTHVSSFAIVGVGSNKGLSNINWKTVKHMLFSWVITIPVSGAFAIISYNVIGLF